MPLKNSYYGSGVEFDIFAYNPNVYGGTEYMAKTFIEKVLPHLPKLNNYNCILMPGYMYDPMVIENHKKDLIIWMHNTVYQFDPKVMAIFFTNGMLKKIKYIITVSEFQKKEVIQFLGIDESKVVVIPNAIEPLVYNPDKFNNPKKIKLITTSTFERGGYVLLNALRKVEEDFRLEMYNDFYPHTVEGFKADPRVRFFGKTPKQTVLEAVEDSHIHAYPSVYPETFCLSQVEAMSAGLKCVTSDIGALPEVSNGLTTMYPYIEELEKHEDIFAEHLTKAIQDVKQGNWNPEEQIKYVNSEYSWERHKERWLELHDKL